MNNKRIALLGLGTIGQVVFDELVASTNGAWQLAWVVVKHPERHQTVLLPTGAQLTTDWRRAAEDPTVDVVIELIGGIGVAKEAVTSALLHGKQVITANKDLVATAGTELDRLAELYGGALTYEAAVAGGIPIIRTINEGLAPDRIRRVSGILNGTSNYILTAIDQEGLSFDAALKEAKAKGFAEANPTKDVTGIDAAYKLIILTKLIFHRTLSLAQLAPTGIDHLSPRLFAAAKEWGLKIKLLASTWESRGQLNYQVAPVALNPSHPLYQVDGVTNAVVIDSDLVGTSTYLGPGAGGKATANSVLADLASLSRGEQLTGSSACLRIENGRPLTKQRYLVVNPTGLPTGLQFSDRQATSALTPALTPTDLQRLRATNPGLETLALGE